MDFRNLIKQSEFVDTTLQIMKVVDNARRWEVIAGSGHWGKTTLLSMLYYYFNEDLETKLVRIGSDSLWIRYIVLGLNDTADSC